MRTQLFCLICSFVFSPFCMETQAQGCDDYSNVKAPVMSEATRKAFEFNLAQAAEIRRMLQTKDNALGNASQGYGFGNWLLYNGRAEEAYEVFSQITKGESWAAFGYIAAEAELKRLE